MTHLLFIDDDLSLLKVNQRYFEDLGYQVTTADSGLAYEQLLEDVQPDCLILDVMMPDLDGFQLGRLIRSISDVPIIYLTGKTDDDSLVAGLDLGANDYLKKPYTFKELEARIKVQLRLSKTASVPKGLLTFGPLKVDYLNHKVYHLDEEIYLSNREYELLYFLVSHPNQTLTYQAIGQHVWGYYEDNDRQTIMVTTSRLRKKLESYPKLVNHIESVYAKGYQFTSKGAL